METIVAVPDARDKQPEASVILQPKLTVRQRSELLAVAAPLERRDTDAIAECPTETRIVESSGERLTDRPIRAPQLQEVSYAGYRLTMKDAR